MLKKVEIFSDKELFHPIKSFLQVNLEDHISLFALYFPGVRDYLLNNDGIVISLLLERNLDLVGLMSLIRNGLSLLAIILVITLY